MDNRFTKSNTNCKYNYYVPRTTVLSGWKYYGTIGLMAGTVLLTLYPILLDPLLHIDKYKKAHEEAKVELFQAGMLPGQLKKWEDPWKKK